MSASRESSHPSVASADSTPAECRHINSRSPEGGPEESPEQSPEQSPEESPEQSPEQSPEGSAAAGGEQKVTARDASRSPPGSEAAAAAAAGDADADAPADGSSAAAAPAAGHVVFAKGLPVEMKADDVRTFFSACGEITGVSVKQNFDNRFCFVEFATEEAVSEALKLSGTMFADAKIVVERKTGRSIAARATAAASTRCHRCGELGHKRASCMNPQSSRGPPRPLRGGPPRGRSPGGDDGYGRFRGPRCEDRRGGPPRRGGFDSPPRGGLGGDYRGGFDRFDDRGRRDFRDDFRRDGRQDDYRRDDRDGPRGDYRYEGHNSSGATRVHSGPPDFGRYDRQRYSDGGPHGGDFRGRDRDGFHDSGGGGDDYRYERGFRGGDTRGNPRTGARPGDGPPDSHFDDRRRLDDRDRR